MNRTQAQRLAWVRSLLAVVAVLLAEPARASLAGHPREDLLDGCRERAAAALVLSTEAAPSEGRVAARDTAPHFRLFAAAGAGTLDETDGTCSAADLGCYRFEYGEGDQLHRLTAEHANEVTSFDVGNLGRIVSRNGAEFGYDLSGRRLEDDRFTYTWDWRGRLVQRDVKASDGSGERVTYSYDAAGRLLTRTQLGAIPPGHGDADRPFVAKRVFTWDGQRLAAEAGLNFQDQPIWRQQYVPGPRWLDDAPQVRVEAGLQTSTPTVKTYGMIRDEVGSVLAVVEDAAPGAGPLKLLGRYHYSPYGTTHLELGPELVEIRFDATVTQVGSQTQSGPVPGEIVGGTLRIRTTLPLAPTTLVDGVVIEVWNGATSTWEPADRAEFAVGPADDDVSELRVMRLAGWPKGARYRVTLMPSLADAFGRLIRLPAGEVAGVRIELEIPTDGTTPPTCERKFTQSHDPDTAASTLDGAFPGGQTSLFQGLWHDPEGGLAYARARWYDPRNAAWLSEDPLGPVDSPNLYQAFGLDPQNNTDPLGLATDWNDTPEARRARAQAAHQPADTASLKFAAGLALGQALAGPTAVLRASPFARAIGASVGAYRAAGRVANAYGSGGMSAARGQTATELKQAAAAYGEQVLGLVPGYGTYQSLKQIGPTTEREGPLAGGLQAGQAFSSLRMDIAIGLGVGKGVQAGATSLGTAAETLLNDAGLALSTRGPVLEGLPVLRGSLNPVTSGASQRGILLHSDLPDNLPSQLRLEMPDTLFEFTRQGQRGQDVRVVGGEKHPSEYPGSPWPSGVLFGDFKPDTLGGRRTFASDQRNKWTEPTYMLPYDPATGKLVWP